MKSVKVEKEDSKFRVSIMLDGLEVMCNYFDNEDEANSYALRTLKD